MRSIALMSLALLAACEPAGVQFIVEIPADYGADGDPQVKLPDEVRLFIGVGDEIEDTIAPEGFGRREGREGTYWLRDPSNVDPEVDRAPIGVGSPAVFSFARAGDVDELGVVIAVGYTGGEPTSSAAVFHARVGSSRVFQYRLGLNSAADPRDRSQRTRVNQLAIWGDDECIHIDNRRTDIQDSGHRVAFIVGSAEDRDCDGLREGDPKECFPDAHLGVGVSDQPVCLHQSAMDTRCSVGVTGCRDGVGTAGNCNPSRFCLPPAVCSKCSTPGDSWMCAQDYQSHADNTPGSYGLDCIFPGKLSGAVMTYELCGNRAEVTLVPPPGTTCEAVAAKALADPAFTNSFALTGPSNTARIKVAIDANCVLTLEPDGLVTGNGNGSVLDFGALMLVALDGGRGVGAPVHIQVAGEAGCSNSPVCEWVDTGDTGSPDSPNDCVLGPLP